MKIPKKRRDEIEHLKKTGIPRCQYCKKPFVNGYDSITKKISKYYWIPDCGCMKEGIGMMIG